MKALPAPVVGQGLSILSPSARQLLPIRDALRAYAAEHGLRLPIAQPYQRFFNLRSTLGRLFVHEATITAQSTFHFRASTNLALAAA